MRWRQGRARRSAAGRPAGSTGAADRPRPSPRHPAPPNERQPQANSQSGQATPLTAPRQRPADARCAHVERHAMPTGCTIRLTTPPTWRRCCKLGFDASSGRDLDKRSLEDKVREFDVSTAPASAFFYAGHAAGAGTISFHRAV
jgi:hypothetical protein